jgi:hypothetical protein
MSHFGTRLAPRGRFPEPLGVCASPDAGKSSQEMTIEVGTEMDGTFPCQL